MLPVIIIEWSHSSRRLRIQMDMHVTTEHQINKAQIDRTASGNKQNYNYYHVIHHKNMLEKKAEHMIVPIYAEKALEKNSKSIPNNISQQIQNRMDFPQSEQGHLPKHFIVNMLKY